MDAQTGGGPADRPRLGPTARDLLALAVLVAVLFHRALFLGEIFFERDVSAWWWGQTEVFVRAVASGAWPLWDATMGFGQPLLANPSMQVFYPWTWLNLLVSPEVSYTVYVVGHACLAAAGMYVLGAHLGLSRRGALLAAAVWMLSGPYLSTASLWHHQAGAALLPWVAWAADRLLAAPSVRRAAGLAALFALQVVAGSAEMSAMGLVLVAGAAVRRLAARPPRPIALVAAVALSLALGAGLSAAQWLPTIDHVSHGTERAALSASVRTYWSVSPALAPQLLVPAMVQRLPLSPSGRERLYETDREPFFASLYLGLAALPLVVLALLHAPPPHRGLARLAFVLLLVSAAVALGRHFVAYGVLTTIAPPFQVFRFPVKATMLTAFAWALLAGIGWTGWEGGGLSRRARAVAGGAVVLAAALVFGAGLCAFAGREWAEGWLSSGDGSAGPVLRGIGAQLLATTLLTLVVGLGLLRPPAWLSRGRGAWVLGAVVADLYLVHAGLNPTAPASHFARPPSTVALLRGVPLPRVFVFDYMKIAGKPYRYRPPEDAVRAMSPPRHEVLRMAEVAQNTVPALRRWGVAGSFENEMIGLGAPYVRALAAFLQSQEETPGFVRLLRLAAVHVVLARHTEGLETLVPVGTSDDGLPAPIHILAVPDPLPRAYAVGTSRVETGVAAYRSLVDPAFDPAREVVLREGTPRQASAAFQARTSLSAYKADRVVADVELSEPGYLVVTDAFAEDWAAVVDGVAAPVLRANVAFRAVPVPAGRHTVEMRYRPRAIVAGLWISAVSAVVLGALLLRSRGAALEPRA